MIEYTHTSAPGLDVPFEGEVDLLDTVALGARAEFRFRARRPAAEQNEVALVHDDFLERVALALTDGFFVVAGRLTLRAAGFALPAFTDAAFALPARVVAAAFGVA
ncbi:MAG TPA: hypothetical protein VK595_02150, partial [Vicinamibacterales bacterium]|nr:hypothetical protein [Vicinamibacterales bacterium]